MIPNYDYEIEKRYHPENFEEDDIRISDIIKMGQDISGDWLKTEADKKVIVQEHLQKQKGKEKKKTA